MMRKVEASISINRSPALVLSVFTEYHHLSIWWNVEKALIDLRKGGLYALVWGISGKGMNYVSTGIIGEYLQACQLRIDQLVYFNPERPILGPMELLIMTTPENGKTTLSIIQSGYQHGKDWDWYYDAVKQAWPQTILKIKEYVEGL